VDLYSAFIAGAPVRITVLPANYTVPASTWKVFTRRRHHWL